MKEADILKRLVEIRIARRAKFVPYDLDRRMKRTEDECWELAEAVCAGKEVQKKRSSRIERRIARGKLPAVPTATP